MAENGADKHPDDKTEANQPIECASPPCLMHEVDPAYFGLCDNRPATAKSEAKPSDAAIVNVGAPADASSANAETPSDNSK